MFKYKIIKIFIGLFFLSGLLLPSCSKFLEEKPAANLAVITSLDDLQAMLDYFQRMNQWIGGIGEASSDNFYLPTSTFNSLSESNRNIYTWREDIYSGSSIGDNVWAAVNNPIYVANVVLDAIEDIPVNSTEVSYKRSLIGASHFFRARSLHVMATNWAPAYERGTASQKLGVPLRLSPDFNNVTTRSTVEQTYQQIIRDLETAILYLPSNVLHPMRPSKPAAYALLSRVYLSMQEYDKAWRYADSSLLINDFLLDYNNLNASSLMPIPQFNNEVLFHAMGTVAVLNPENAVIDSVLFLKYDEHDLRKSVFFQSNGNGTYRFKGNYFNGSTLFTGLTVAEAYLNLAEGLIRTGNIERGLSALNSLLHKRWKHGEFELIEVESQSEALEIVLDERRKELVMRDVRWMDLKRLNLENTFKTTIRRVIDGVEFVLSPDDLRYNLQFPMSVIEMTGIQPNPR